MNIGYREFIPDNLGGPVTLVTPFVTTSGLVFTIFGTDTDLAVYDPLTSSANFITPTYSDGFATVAVGFTTVAGIGTTFTANVKAGDYISFGSSSERAASADWFLVDSVTNDTELVLATPSTVAQVGGDYTVRQTFTSSDTDFWDFATFPNAPIGALSGLPAGDHWYATNGSVIVGWASGPLEVSIVPYPFTARTITLYKNMLHFGQVVSGGVAIPGAIQNTALADPENVTTLEASLYLALDGADTIVATRKLGDYMAVYGESSIAIVQFVGAPVNFLIRTISSRIGLFGPKAIIDFGNYHEIVSRDRGYRFDGVRLSPFGDQLFTKVLETSDLGRAARCVAAISEAHLEVYWLIPAVDDGEEDNASVKNAWTEHYAEDVGRSPTPFSHRAVDAMSIGNHIDQRAVAQRWSDFLTEEFTELAFRFNDRFFSRDFPKTLFGGADGKVYEMNTSNSFPGTSILESYIVTPMRPLGEVDGKGIIRRVEPQVERFAGDAGSIFLTPRGYDRPTGLPESKGSRGVRVDHSGKRFSSHRVPGRYGDVVIGTTQSGNSWRMSGYFITADELHPR